VIEPTQLVSYKIVSTLPLPENTSKMYEYLFAGNGVFVRAIRPGLEVIMPIETFNQPIRGLPALEPQLKFNYPQIPKDILLSIWQQSCLAEDENKELIEILFYLEYRQQMWRLLVPSQIQRRDRCQPTHPYHEALVELHSHGSMNAFFSATDNAEENGFRIYAVIGKLDTNHPEILVRIGVFGYLWTIEASQIFELPNFFVDASFKEQLL
jgi:PRTRC genetic system protein A